MTYRYYISDTAMMCIYGTDDPDLAQRAARSVNYLVIDTLTNTEMDRDASLTIREMREDDLEGALETPRVPKSESVGTVEPKSLADRLSLEELRSALESWKAVEPAIRGFIQMRLMGTGIEYRDSAGFATGPGRVSGDTDAVGERHALVGAAHLLAAHILGAATALDIERKEAP